MNLCGTCKHWGKEPNIDPEFRECQAIYLGKEENNWKGPPDDDEREYEPELAQRRDQFREANKAFTLDASNYQAALRCRSDFGCVLHEQQDRPAS